MKLYICRFTDTGLMLHSYTAKSLQPQSKAEQSRAKQIHRYMFQLQCSYSTGLQPQVYSYRASEIQSLRATGKQLQSHKDTCNLQSHRASLQSHSYTAANLQSRIKGCKSTKQSYKLQNFSGKCTSVHVIVGQF